MARFANDLENTALRAGSFFCYLMTWISSIIVVGIVGNFLERFSNRGVDIVYIEVIAVITMVVYLVGMLAPCLPKYGGHLAPLHLIFSYLWLTAFIFTAQRWSHHRCRAGIPVGGQCGKKHAVEAFTFLAFFFILCNLIVEGLLFRAHRRTYVNEPTHHTKERPASGVSGVSGDTGTTAPPPAAPAAPAATAHPAVNSGTAV
ncbi:uncharacterized protein TRIREDRAFT_122324 [Trichoderma reesei QM6a]|uniref:Predicted protein n=2 Tax=Hypocrea jecorina TaxID=51453 RepID=G0RLF9_HYPJQ|nr:uncharacterized protein TRIREDRAFT_122324 [Trichoderma reesei QM6a]EGR47978.1 predicted protein [Trichoderma reesei QM6a]ETS02201.1 hypothetical protein M419DRAFT_99054 [Trichoderma reesei RUT C-30]